MSTQFEVEADPTCDNPAHTQTLTVGMSAGGWAFLLQAYPEPGDGHPALTSWAEWRAWLAGRTIVDEYGREYTLDTFAERVERAHADNIRCQVRRQDAYDYHDAQGYDLTKRRVG